MSELKPSKIRCKKCGYEPNIITDVCIKCGGEIIKICGNCGYENSVEKIYCDSCGALLALTPHKKIDIEDKKDTATKETPKKTKIEFEPITDTMSREDSYRKRMEESKEKKEMEPGIEKINNVKKEAQIIQKYTGNKEEQRKDTQKDTSTTVLNPPEKNRKRFLIIISVSIIVSLIFSYVFFIRQSISKYQLLFRAKGYLTALKNKDYEKAYSYLSNNSKTLVNFVDFLKVSEDYYSKIGDWDFKDVKIYYFDENNSVISYKLKEGGEWRDDYLNFIKEYNIWTRPYVWNIFEDIDNAINSRDISKALFLSQKLYLIDPLDPRASGYLCWSEYFMGLYDKSVESCRRTFEISQIYPIKYYNDEDLFWYRFSYADSLKFTNRVEEAIKVFDYLLSQPDVSIKSKCSSFIARADSYSKIKKYDSTLADLQSAFSICPDGVEKKEAQNRINMLNGLGCNDSIKLFKRCNFEGQKFENYILTFIKDLKSRDKKANYNLNINCNHLEGPYYEVEGILKNSKKNQIISIYKGKINLWERSGEIIKED